MDRNLLDLRCSSESTTGAEEGEAAEGVSVIPELELGSLRVIVHERSERGLGSLEGRESFLYDTACQETKNSKRQILIV
jgi:hypothetical protein